MGSKISLSLLHFWFQREIPASLGALWGPYRRWLFEFCFAVVSQEQTGCLVTPRHQLNAASFCFAFSLERYAVIILSCAEKSECHIGSSWLILFLNLEYTPRQKCRTPLPLPPLLSTQMLRRLKRPRTTRRRRRYLVQKFEALRRFSSVFRLFYSFPFYFCIYHANNSFVIVLRSFLEH